MRKKKIVSIALTTVLAAAMAMPAVAAGGVLNVDVTTISAVLRVQVPTQMSAEVDQFETVESGTQIVASEFDMINLSEIDVKVDVTSTVKLGNGVTLASEKETAADSVNSEAWLAVAAKSAEKSYDDAATENIKEQKSDLSELNSNVTVFDSAGNEAEQSFYLAKGTGNTIYKLAIPKGGKADVSYAQFYELTELSTHPANDKTLQAAVDAGDVYVIATADKGTNGAKVEKLSKGTKNVVWASGNTYYRSAASPSTTVEDGKLYVYGETSEDGGKAGFTYIGRLSDSKADWTKDDIVSFNISYTITGISSSKYEEMKDDCVYGYYCSFQAVTAVLTVSKNGIIRMRIPPEDFNALYLNVNGQSWRFDDTKKGNWTIGAASLKFEMDKAWMDRVKGKTLTVSLVLKDGTIHSITADFPG